MPSSSQLGMRGELKIHVQQLYFHTAVDVQGAEVWYESSADRRMIVESKGMAIL